MARWSCFVRQRLWDHSLSGLFLMQRCLRAWRSRPNSFDFPAMSFAHRDVSRFSQSFDDIMYFTDKIFNVFKLYHWGTLLYFWHFSTICRPSLLQIAEPLPIFTSLRWERLSKVPSNATDLLPMNLITSMMFLKMLLLSTTYFSRHFLPWSQQFWDMLLPSHSRRSNYF